MSKKEKRIRRFFDRPESLKYPEIENILLDFGFRKIVAKGSHIRFKHFLAKADLIIPVHSNDCKSFYKRMIAKSIKKLIL